MESFSCTLQFGEIDIDSELVAHQDFLEDDQQIMMLNNGCLCCTVKDDLIRMLCELVCSLPSRCKSTAYTADLTLLVSAQLIAMRLYRLPHSSGACGSALHHFSVHVQIMLLNSLCEAQQELCPEAAGM